MSGTEFWTGTGMFAAGFRMIFVGSLDRQTAWVSDDEAPFDPASPPALDENTMRQLTPLGPAGSPRPFVVSRIWPHPRKVLPIFHS